MPYRVGGALRTPAAVAAAGQSGAAITTYTRTQIDSKDTAVGAAAAVDATGKAAAAVDKVLMLTAPGSNGAGSITLTGALSTMTLVSVLNVTDGVKIANSEFSTFGTGTLTQTSGTDYSGKSLIFQVKTA